ncbi:hypothetical protein VD0002_g3997 [Verticillium dahliae]|uniref:Conidiation-specific protein 8 n=1 Tax=Verticillium dahliae TaxID=27337 RepID=A0AA45ALX5_VERDA|nr:hypothetical protein VdG2_05483 [Verticillium dahliae VDG2]KAH6700256.1 hypothetical protein EV126DRAFT_511980 [Verticillium dahliae]PNH31900.1 hypothetical protein BJF96_g4796 [Verticillium dahliae]PNH51775.1 hypothetical protein VD0003_g5515 [Verticillium dahliae]PNH64789.1 hypothetical protein VD0002_g3997 [Verticillium dahliae]
MDPSKPADQLSSSPTDRRRSSNTLFAGLVDQKRGTQGQARRQSLHDQQVTPGMFGKMWRNFTAGPASPPK